MASKRAKNLRGRPNDNYILNHYVVPYSMTSNSRYKHIDEIKLYDGKLIKATLNPVDLGILPNSSGTYYSMTSADDNRIDLVALKFYGSSSLWWIICYANGISDPLDMGVDLAKPLWIPNLSGLRVFPNPLS